MTYNVHACRGRDGRVDVGRVAQVIDDNDPDVVCLQELDVGHVRSSRLNQPELLAELTNRKVHFHAARAAEGSKFGNATLCRYPFDLIHEGSLPATRDEARAAHCLRVEFPSGQWIRIVNTHLSIRFNERIAQVRALLSDDEPLERTKESFAPLVAPYRRLVLCGDLNAGGWSPVARWLHGKLRDVQQGRGHRRLKTWPSGCPLLRLDHIWVGPEVGIKGSFVPRGGASRTASDHLPLVADLCLPFEGQV